MESLHLLICDRTATSRNPPPPILANVDNIKENGKHKYLRVHVSIYASHLFTMSQRLWVQIMCTSCEIKLLAIHTKAIVQRV